MCIYRVLIIKNINLSHTSSKQDLYKPYRIYLEFLWDHIFGAIIGSLYKTPMCLTNKSCTFQILNPVSALVIVDVQHDFIDGSLSLSNCPAGQNGHGVIEPINYMLDNVGFDLVVYTRDWHPEGHISFYDSLDKRKLHSDCKV